MSEKTLGNFRIVEPIGKGGMGVVVKAVDERLGRSVALKILPPEFAADDDRRARFEREARAAANLSHPNITQIFDVGNDDGTSYIAMEFVEGETLAARIQRGAIGIGEIVAIAAQIVDALDEAHRAGIIHRDIKPANVMVTPSGRVKVLDFGLAKSTSSLDQSASEMTTQMQTETGAVLGTVHYMSPEQALGKNVDGRGDIFSLGVVLYEMATGTRPFSGDTATETIDKISHAQPEAIARFNYDVPQDLERIVRKCLEKDPERRYQTSRELLVDLRNLERDSAPSGPVSASSEAAARRRPRRTAVAVVALAALFLVAWVGSRWLLAPAQANIESIAVLPFENATDDPDATHLCDGVAETLINTLSQLPELRVISRRSAFKFRGQHADVQEVGRKLDVQAVLVGHMVRRGDNLTINAELVDVSNNEQLWGNRYDRPLDDLLDVEQALAKDIVGGLRIRLSGEQEAQLAHRPTDDPEAYELFLKGKRLMVGTAVEMQKASEYLEQAVELDQSFALAYATLSQVYALQPRHGLENQTAAFRKARAAAETALELDSNLAEAHSAMASVKFEFDWDWMGAEKSYKKAVALRPGNDWTYVQYSDFLVAMGRPREAIEMARRAVALDPQSVRAPHWIGIAQIILGEHDAAAAQFRHALELDPNWTWGHIKGGVALAKAGRIDEALREAAEAEADLFGADTPLARSWLGCVYAIAGEREQAEAALVRIEEFSEGLRLEGLATVCLCLGRRDEALDYVEQALEARSSELAYARVFPALWDPGLENEPRFIRVLEKLGLDDMQIP